MKNMKKSAITLTNAGYLPTKHKVAPLAKKSYGNSILKFEGEGDAHHETTVQYTSKNGTKGKMSIDPHEYRQTNARELSLDLELQERVRKGELELIAFQREKLPEVRDGKSWIADVKKGVEPKLIATSIDPNDLGKILSPDKHGVTALNPDVMLFTRKVPTANAGEHHVAECGALLERSRTQILTVGATLFCLVFVFVIVSGDLGG